MPREARAAPAHRLRDLRRHLHHAVALERHGQAVAGLVVRFAAGWGLPNSDQRIPR